MSPTSKTTAGLRPTSQRRRVMAICAQATIAELNAGIAAVQPLPELATVRAPELGLVMLRGRMGGDGAPFNVGEATVARAAVRLASGELGVGYVLGRSLEKARLAATVEALAQVPDYRTALESALLAPVAARRAEEKGRHAAETAATRVDFFTVTRGED